MSTVTDLLQNGRRLVPASKLPAMVERRVDKLWDNERYVARQEEHMRHLLEFTDRAPEIPEIARKYAEKMMLRTWLRWHPGVLTRQPVRDVKWLTTESDPSRPAILSFMHHNQYDGMFGSLKRHGAKLWGLGGEDALGAEAPAQVRQHFRVVERGCTVIPTTGGTSAILEALKPGVTLAIASDVASQTEAMFLGRRVRVAAGAARIAMQSDSPVIAVTAVRDGEDSHHLQVHEPLESRDYTDPMELLDAMLAIHAEAVLAWPEAHENPRARFGSVDD